MAQRQQQVQDLPLDGAEVRLALAREDVGDRAALACLDQLVDVLDAPAEPSGQGPRHGGLAGGHEADQKDLIDRHRA